MSCIGLCRDCRHWRPSQDAIKRLPDYSRALPPNDWWNDALCVRIERGIDIILEVGLDGAFVDRVETDANFGCMLFEANPGVQAEEETK